MKHSYDIEIHAPSQAIFDLLHDYDRRLEWDPFLRAADIVDGSPAAGPGVRTLCVARRRVGGMGMETEYVSFSPPQVAAVRMTDGPALFGRFSASIRHRALADDRTRVTYTFNLETRPRWLQGLLTPIVAWVMGLETRRRLQALKAFMESPAQ